MPGCVAANGVDAAGRRAIVALKEHIAIDLPSPRMKLRFTWARAHFLLVGHSDAARPAIPGAKHTDNQGVLVGRLVLLPKHVVPGQARRLGQLLNALTSSLTPRTSSAHMDQAVAETESRLSAASVSGVGADEAGLVMPAATFALYRTGELRIWISPTDLPDRFVALPRNLSGAARQKRLHELKEAFAVDLSRHFYYFVRDLVHRHYHHHRSSDHILPLVAAGRNDDVSWRRDTLYALARAALQSRRKDDLLAYRSAQGMIAYADLFQATLSSVRRSKRSYAKHERNADAIQYDWQHLRASIQARAEEKLWRYGGRIQLFAILTSVTVAVVALWFAVAQVSQLINISATPDTPEWRVFHRLSLWLYTHPLSAIAVAGILSGLAFEFSGRGLRSIAIFRDFLGILRRPFLAVGVELSERLRRWLPQYGDIVSAAVIGILNLALALASGFLAALLLKTFSF